MVFQFIYNSVFSDTVVTLIVLNNEAFEFLQAKGVFSVEDFYKTSLN